MTYTKALFIACLFLYYVPHTYAQDTLDVKEVKKEMTTWQTIKYDGLSVYGGVKHVYTSPFRWKGKEWLTFGGIMAGHALLLSVDEPASEVFIKQGNGVPTVIKEAGFRFGKPLLNYGLTTSVYTLGLLTKNEKIRRTGVLLIASATAGGLFQTLSSNSGFSTMDRGTLANRCNSWYCYECSYCR